MDRERARLLIRNQQREQQRSRSPRAAGLRSFLAARQSQPDRHSGGRITLQDVRRGREGLRSHAGEPDQIASDIRA